MNHEVLQRTGLIAATIALIFCAYWAVRLAYAEHVGPERAVQIAPMNAKYWLRLADAREEIGERAGDALERALAANPLDSRVWIRAGLAAEAEGDFPRAERCLQRAAAVSRLYEPAWALANYYFRRNNPGEFRRWMRRAAEMSYGDLAPLFDLACRISKDPETVLAALPSTGPAVRAWLDYLLVANRLDAAASAAARLSARGSPGDRDALLRYVNRMLYAGQSSAAIDTWNALCQRRALPYAVLTPMNPVTNADFAHTPLAFGFDWRMPQPPGTSWVWAEHLGQVHIWFSGRQPERCEVLGQYAPVEPGHAYHLRLVYQTRDIPAGTGLGWRVDAARGATVAQIPHLSSEEWRSETVSFTVPHETELVRLALVYERAIGTVRIEGEVAIRGVSLEQVQ